jgi:hypothetical protein
MNLAESFIFPGTGSPTNWSPLRASLKTSLVDALPQAGQRHIEWNRVLGAVFLVGVSAMIWASVGVALAHWWK